MVNFGKLFFGLLWSVFDRSLQIIVRKHCGRPWQWSKLQKTDNLLSKMVFLRKFLDFYNQNSFNKKFEFGHFEFFLIQTTCQRVF